MKKSISCSCKVCVDMCKTQPCIGTPAQAEGLIDAGHALRLKPIRFGSLMLLEPLRGKEGHCTFLEKERCGIYDTQPLEGRLADHTNVTVDVRSKVLKSWKHPSAGRVLSRWMLTVSDVVWGL